MQSGYPLVGFKGQYVLYVLMGSGRMNTAQTGCYCMHCVALAVVCLKWMLSVHLEMARMVLCRV